MKKKVLKLLGLGITFLLGMVVGYAMAEDEYTDYMNSMFEDEDEDDFFEDEEIAEDLDKADEPGKVD